MILMIILFLKNQKELYIVPDKPLGIHIHSEFRTLLFWPMKCKQSVEVECMQFVCSQHAKDTEEPLKKGKPNNEMIVMFFIKIYFTL